MKTPNKTKERVKRGVNKTFQERADYLSMITPSSRNMYQAIANFFWPDAIAPTPTIKSVKNKR